MSGLAPVMGETMTAHPLKTTFLKWQCRVRQIAMREAGGRPDDAVTPAVVLAGETSPMGHVITVLNKKPGHSVTPELKHMAARTGDPAEMREQALRFFSAGYYQSHKEFSDILTATFSPGSQGAAEIRAAERCRLVFEAYSQRFDIAARAWRLTAKNPLYEATIAHNRLFNPALSPDTEVLAFEPDWPVSTCDPGMTS